MLPLRRRVKALAAVQSREAESSPEQRARVEAAGAERPRQDCRDEATVHRLQQHRNYY